MDSRFRFCSVSWALLAATCGWLWPGVRLAPAQPPAPAARWPVAPPTDPRLPVATAGPRADAPPAADDPETLYELITSVVLDNLPTEYEDQRHWGMQKKIWQGVRFSGKPLELKMNSREKLVNHGTWRMYRITLVDPQQRFQARVADIHRTGSGRLGFDAIVTARVHGFARLSKWESGVQLISLSTDAQADVELRLRCEAGLRFDMADILPAVNIEPEITDAELRLLSFRLQRISRLNGPLVHELGKSLRGLLENEIERKRHKMVARINSQISKNRDKLRFSPAKLGKHAWSELADRAGRE